MPRRKKRATEMTTDEFMKDLFPKKVREEAKRVAEKSRKSKEKSPHKRSLHEAICCVKYIIPVKWRKVNGYSKTGGPHKSGNDRADEVALAAKKGAMRSPTPPLP